MPSALPPIKITVGRYDLSYEAENITFSNADPGGYEMASFDLQSSRANIINPGDRVIISDGLGIIWQGRVAEPAKTIKHGWAVSRRVGSATTRVSCEGAGAAMKDNLMSMVYIDRDLTRWTDWSIDRQYKVAVTNANDASAFSWQIGAASSGAPGIVFSEVGPFYGLNPEAEAWYDAGPQNVVYQLRVANATFMNFGASASAHGQLIISADLLRNNQLFFNFDATGAVINASVTSSLGYRYGVLVHWYSLAATVSAGAAGTTYGLQCAGVSVIGNHGLPLQTQGYVANPADKGTTSDWTTDGFRPDQIAYDAALRCLKAGGNLRIGRIDQTPAFVVLHYVQYTPVPHDTVISDMAKLAPAHYGVWESDSVFDDTPAFTFRNYTTVADTFTSLADCNEADVSERLANLYTAATITYQDAAGNAYASTVSLPNYILQSVGINRTTTLDLGISSAGVASVFASYVLQALFAQARTAGSLTLPRKVRDSNGAPIPSYRLKAGINRIRVNDLPTRAGLLTAYDNDSFRISRVENNIDTTSGEIQTRVEIDAGPNLIETLQARLAISSTLAGEG